MLYLLGPPQYAIEEPIHSKNKADNHKEFSLPLNNFTSLNY